MGKEKVDESIDTEEDYSDYNSNEEDYDESFDQDDDWEYDDQPDYEDDDWKECDRQNRLGKLLEMLEEEKECILSILTNHDFLIKLSFDDYSWIVDRCLDDKQKYSLLMSDVLNEEIKKEIIRNITSNDIQAKILVTPSILEILEDDDEIKQSLDTGCERFLLDINNRSNKEEVLEHLSSMSASSIISFTNENKEFLNKYGIKVFEITERLFDVIKIASISDKIEKFDLPIRGKKKNLFIYTSQWNCTCCFIKKHKKRV